MTAVLGVEGNEKFSFIILEIKKTNSGVLFGSHAHSNDWFKSGEWQKKLYGENCNVTYTNPTNKG